MSVELRTIALKMLNAAHGQRNAAEGRLWEARDRVTELRLRYLEAQAAEAFAQRDFDRAQEFLQMIWTDVRPIGEDSAVVAPSAATQTAETGPTPE